MKRLLVLDANQRSALAVIRSLGTHDVPVFSAEESPSALSSHSRLSKQHFTYTSPRLNPDQFIKDVARHVNENHLDILLPMTELTTTLLLIHQTYFPEAVIPFPDISTVDSIADKCSLMRLAENLSIPVPHTLYVKNPENPDYVLEELCYPVVFKPGRSWQLHTGQWQRASVRFANNIHDAKSIIDSDPAFKEYPYMIQKCVEGQGQGIFALYNQGSPITFFAHRRLREKPPRGGVSVLSESVEINPVLRTYAASLLSKANWHGVAMVEFKISPDGTPYLMEINTRFWGSLQLAIDAGVDFPWLLYQLTCGKQPEPVNSYKTGIRLRWLLGDLDNLYLTLRDKHYSYSEKLNAVRHFLTPSPFKTRHEVDRWNDLGPAWYEAKQYLRDIVT